MSHIDKAQTMALTATRAKRAPFTVQPLEVVQVGGQAAALIQAYKLATTKSVWDAIEADRATAWPKMPAADKLAVKEASESAFMGLTDVPV
jgi:hypothetical protein